TILKLDDHVLMFISDEFFIDKEMKLTNTKKLSNIIYEDENYLIIDKEVGLKVHSDIHEDEDTLIQRVKKYLIDTRQYDPTLENSFTPALANRLDQNTGGLVIACKNAKSLRAMNEMIRCHEVEKHYVCIIEKQIKNGLYKHYYKKDSTINKAIINDKPFDNSTLVQLAIRTLETNNNYSLLDIHLITGKSHQIRAQLAYLGHPLIGDRKYGGSSLMKYQALYAYKLAFHTSNKDFQYLNQLKFIKEHNFVTLKYQEMIR
ncbi:MAG: RluA family pseudouridine synthase, partial [Traorella sp.]